MGGAHYYRLAPSQFAQSFESGEVLYGSRLLELASRLTPPKALVLEEWDQLADLVCKCELGGDKIQPLDRAVKPDPGTLLPAEETQTISEALNEISARQLWARFVAASAQARQVMPQRPRYIPEVVEMYTFLQSYEALCRFFAEASAAGDAILFCGVEGRDFTRKSSRS